MIRIPCNKANYGKSRKHSDVKFIVIHYTGNNNDRAENNGKYFQTAGRHASAHFFVGQDGTIVKSVNLNKVAWSVGGGKYSNCAETGGGKWYGICTNANSVSIELCDNLYLSPSEEQVKAVARVIKYIRKYCKNADHIIRHFDVTGKECPKNMTDITEEKRKRWNVFKSEVYLYADMDKK